MARTDNLTNYLTDVAEAIREKKGTTETIEASKFDEEIKNLPSGGGSGDEELEASYLSAIDNTLGSNVTKLPTGITTIGNYAFYNRTKLALTSLPNSITSIGQYAFYSCSNLVLTSLPSNLTTIGNNAFYQCSNLTLTSLPNSITSIGQYAFNGCSNLALTSLPAGVTVIQQYSFRNCRNLTEMSLLGNLTSIGLYAFNGCFNLAKLVLPNVTKVPTLSSSSALTSTPIASGTGYIYVPDTLVDSFKSASNWSTYASQIKGVSEL